MDNSMFNQVKRAGDSSVREKRNRKFAMGVSAVGATVAALAMALPAGATPTNVNYPAPAANNLLIGSGSSTDYNMMQGLDTLFNQTPGCVITSGSVTGAPSKTSQELDYSCEKNSGGTTLEQVAGTSYLDNPINDVAVEEPPMGSSNGIAQLEEGAGDASGIGTAFTSSNQENVSAINYARSSRDPSSSADIKGLNFVAYAKDGVAPLIFTEFGGAKTPFGKLVSTLPGLTTAQLQGIYNGTIYDWGQLGSKTSEPIFVYSAQEGSGTQSTFKTFLGFDPSAASNPVNCADPVPAGTKVITTPSKSNPVPTFEVLSGTTLVPKTTVSSTCKGPDVIFENEDASILANATSTTEDALATAWQAEQTGTGATPVGDSVFFYSFGKFNLQCEGVKEQVQYLDKSKTVISDSKDGANCGSTPLPTAPADKLALTPVNDVAANAQTILGTGGTVYPIDRFLYNVYSNGSNTNIPEATAATLNYVSEVGFLCKPQTIDGTANDVASNEIIDPSTGVWYHTEIFNTIIANGFIPVTATDSTTSFGGATGLTDGPPKNENASGATHTAYSLLSAGSPAYGATYLNTDAPGQTSNTSIPTSTTPVGYCIVSTTDGNSATS
jgi:ABC-type phosphate transport system substrate-binding protein